MRFLWYAQVRESVTQFSPRSSFCSCCSLLTNSPVTNSLLTEGSFQLLVAPSTSCCVQGYENEQTWFWFFFVYSLSQWYKKEQACHEFVFCCPKYLRLPSPSLQEKLSEKNPWIPDKFLASWSKAHRERVVYYQKCIKLSSTAQDTFKEWFLVNLYWKFLYFFRTIPSGHFQKSCQKYQIWKQASDSSILQLISGAISLRRE